MKCPNCGGSGKEYSFYDGEKSVWKDSVCPTCNGIGQVNSQTNEEWFDSLPTREKAEWLDKVAEDCCQLCDEERREFCNKCIARDCEFENAKKWEIWLKQPHKE